MAYKISLIETFKQNPKRFCGCLRSKQKVKLGISQLGKGDGEFISSDQEVVNILCAFLKLSFFKENQQILPGFPCQSGDEVFFFFLYLTRGGKETLRAE